MLVQSFKDTGGIAAATAKAGCDRYGFINKNFQAVIDIQRFEKHGRSPVGKVGLIQGNLGIRGFNPYIFEAELQKKGIAKIHTAHQRKQLVITVRSLSGNLQEQIDFGGR